MSKNSLQHALANLPESDSLLPAPELEAALGSEDARSLRVQLRAACPSVPAPRHLRQAVVDRLPHRVACRRIAVSS